MFEAIAGVHLYNNAFPRGSVGWIRLGMFVELQSPVNWLIKRLQQHFRCMVVISRVFSDFVDSKSMSQWDFENKLLRSMLLTDIVMFSTSQNQQLIICF